MKPIVIGYNHYNTLIGRIFLDNLKIRDYSMHHKV